MDETYDQLKERIRPEMYEVVRRESGTVLSPGRHVDGKVERHEEPAVYATIRRRSDGGEIVSVMGLNSLTCALPSGGGWRFLRGVDATDEELILSTIDDEPGLG